MYINFLYFLYFLESSLYIFSIMYMYMFGFLVFRWIQVLFVTWYIELEIRVFFLPVIFSLHFVTRRSSGRSFLAFRSFFDRRAANVLSSWAASPRHHIIVGRHVLPDQTSGSSAAAFLTMHRRRSVFLTALCRLLDLGFAGTNAPAGFFERLHRDRALLPARSEIELFQAARLDSARLRSPARLSVAHFTSSAHRLSS
jgi:hypothetical protein